MNEAEFKTRQPLANVNRLENITGQRYGRLTVVGLAAIGPRAWVCKCDCGNAVTITNPKLRCGNNRSCGCLQKEITGARFRTHGMTNQKVYRAWKAMIARCERPKTQLFHRYGGRGISVCTQWRESFQSFFNDMGHPPSSLHSLDRINNNGNYEPGNCRWSTRTEQLRNYSRNVLLTVKGETMPIAAWTERMGFPYREIENRIRGGWSVEDAVLTPIDRRRSEIAARGWIKRRLRSLSEKPQIATGEVLTHRTG